jgi:hypothetical protein
MLGYMTSEPKYTTVSTCLIPKLFWKWQTEKSHKKKIIEADNRKINPIFSASLIYEYLVE